MPKFGSCATKSQTNQPTNGAWLPKSHVSARVHGRTDAVWSLPPPLTCELFTAITREATDALANPLATLILSVPMMGNNANRGRKSWKDRL
ncbi:hypothetical protein AVEN_12157-1 [Araneus ventricosus]|uniref:Uncharacterized protein n=1 Tax=Araneus ventricosus TaxID=182803 RepID=A0A4Y2ERT7_ARAVE|nr:hypothetical protein AVEN_12157-1 [Araneus ventricosus]